MLSVDRCQGHGYDQWPIAGVVEVGECGPVGCVWEQLVVVIDGRRGRSGRSHEYLHCVSQRLFWEMGQLGDEGWGVGGDQRAGIRRHDRRGPRTATTVLCGVGTCIETWCQT